MDELIRHVFWLCSNAPEDSGESVSLPYSTHEGT